MSDYDDRFWTALGALRTGFLAVDTDDGDVVAPMTAHFEERGPLFFYAPADGLLASHLDGDRARPGRFLYAGPEHALFASAEASLEIERDAATRARYWSDEVEEWFPGGPDRADVAMIRCSLGEATVWLAGGVATALGRDRRPRDRRATVAL